MKSSDTQPLSSRIYSSSELDQIGEKICTMDNINANTYHSEPRSKITSQNFFPFLTPFIKGVTRASVSFHVVQGD